MTFMVILETSPLKKKNCGQIRDNFDELAYRGPLKKKSEKWLWGVGNGGEGDLKDVCSGGGGGGVAGSESKHNFLFECK
jgi:hypothetical protein